MLTMVTGRVGVVTGAVSRWGYCGLSGLVRWVTEGVSGVIGWVILTSEPSSLPGHSNAFAKLCRFQWT